MAKILKAQIKHNLTQRTYIIERLSGVKEQMLEIPVYNLNGDLPPKSIKELLALLAK